MIPCVLLAIPDQLGPALEINAVDHATNHLEEGVSAAELRMIEGQIRPGIATDKNERGVESSPSVNLIGLT
jgi:hypothetical protein